jgi:hypothetical protein
MAITRGILILNNQGLDQCAVLDLAYEPGQDLDNAKILGICDQPPAGVVRGRNSGICVEHIRQLDQEGAFVMDN